MQSVVKEAQGFLANQPVIAHHKYLCIDGCWGAHEFLQSAQNRTLGVYHISGTKDDGDKAVSSLALQ